MSYEDKLGAIGSCYFCNFTAPSLCRVSHISIDTLCQNVDTSVLSSRIDLTEFNDVLVVTHREQNLNYLFISTIKPLTMQLPKLSVTSTFGKSFRTQVIKCGCDRAVSPFFV